MNVTTATVPRVGGRVVSLAGPRALAIEDRELPEPAPGEARVRVSAVGVCGTDVHGYLGRADTYPITLGHDAIGRVDAVGDGVVDWSPGDRVVIDPTISCGSCAWCTAARPQLCPSGSYLGMTSPGTMAERITVPADRLVAAPDDLGDVDGTVLEPIAVGLHLLDRIGDFAPKGRRAEVVGGGPLGVLLAQTLHARGWNVLVHEPQAARRAIAERLGLQVVDAATTSTRAPGPLLIVETSASAAGAALALRIAERGSTIALIGRAPLDIPIASILADELTVVGVKSGTGHYAEAIDLVRSGVVTPAATVTHTFDLEDASVAFAQVTDPAQHVMRAVLRIAHVAEKDQT